jgi:hypothetical protein
LSRRKYSAEPEYGTHAQQQKPNRKTHDEIDKQQKVASIFAWARFSITAVAIAGGTLSLPPRNTLSPRSKLDQVHNRRLQYFEMLIGVSQENNIANTRRGGNSV